MESHWSPGFTKLQSGGPTVRSMPADLASDAWLLTGAAEATRYADHVASLGPCPQWGPEFIPSLCESGLRGRGGARFPTWRKWEAVAQRARGRGVVLVNGAEGEPLSWKDRTLMARRPHLVLDGAFAAAAAVGASDLVLYVNATFGEALAALESALAERPELRRRRAPAVRVVEAPPRYIAGEETAAVNFVNGREAIPSFTPPRPFEQGVGGRPTLVQNVETLALAALIARFGPEWFRTAGTPAAPGRLLLTVRGAVERPGTYEVSHGASLADVVAWAGGTLEGAAAILLGGYFGRWVPVAWANRVLLDDDALAAGDLPIGCGVVYVLPDTVCGVAETARVLAFLAGESAGQCGPCRHGLPALARSLQLVAEGPGGAAERDRLERWSRQLASGRGACKHPDGAAGLLRSALSVFGGEIDRHLVYGPCPGTWT